MRTEDRVEMEVYGVMVWMSQRSNQTPHHARIQQAICYSSRWIREVFVPTTTSEIKDYDCTTIRNLASISRTSCRYIRAENAETSSSCLRPSFSQRSRNHKVEILPKCFWRAVNTW